MHSYPDAGPTSACCPAVERSPEPSPITVAVLICCPSSVTLLPECCCLPSPVSMHHTKNIPYGSCRQDATRLAAIQPDGTPCRKPLWPRSRHPAAFRPSSQLVPRRRSQYTCCGILFGQPPSKRSANPTKARVAIVLFRYRHLATQPLQCACVSGWFVGHVCQAADQGWRPSTHALRPHACTTCSSCMPPRPLCRTRIYIPNERTMARPTAALRPAWHFLPLPRPVKLTLQCVCSL